MQPQLPIEVDEQTGIWSTDGLPMIYVPRHFFNNNHLAMEEALGRDTYNAALTKAGHKSAYYWCDQEAKTHGLDPIACYVHYLERLSLRGWGLMEFAEEDLENGKAVIKLDHSAFVLHKKHFDLPSEEAVCYLFEGWFAGAADWVSDQLGWGKQYDCTETQCAAIHDQDHCLFTVTAR